MKEKGFAQVIHIVAAVLIISALFWLYNASIETDKREWQLTNNKVSLPAVSPQTSVAPTNAPTIKPLSPFNSTQEAVKPIAQFDLTTWGVLEDKERGFRLKYPKEWGAPNIVYRNGGQAGKLYSVTFPNSYFIIGGTSKDFSEGRSGSFADFNGFGNTLWWKSPQELCQSTHFNILTCTTSANGAQLLTGGACPEGPPQIASYQKIYFVNMEGKTISGLSFGGSFLPKEHLDQIYTWFCPADPQVSQTRIKSFDRGLIDRKLDPAILRSYDLFEKVFETIEII